MANSILHTTIIEKNASGDKTIIYPKNTTKDVLDGSQTLEQTLNTLKSNDISNKTTAFTQAATRQNLASGETIATSHGKIMKLISDLKSLAFLDKVGVANLDGTLTTEYNKRITTDKVTTSTSITSAGYVADARAINSLQNQINTLNSNTDTLYKNITNNLLYKYMTFPDTIFDIAQRATKSERYFVVNSYFPSDLPEQAEVFIDVMVDQVTARKNIIVWDYSSFRMYKRHMFNGKWLTDWQSNIINSDIAPQNLIEFHGKDDFVEANISYIIKTGVCYVTLRDISITTIGRGRTLTNAMPLPKDGVFTTFTDHENGNVLGLAYIDRNNPCLMIHGFRLGTGWVSFSYVIL